MNEFKLTFASIQKLTEEDYESLKKSYDNPYQFSWIVRDRYDESDSGTFHTYQQAKEYLISLL